MTAEWNALLAALPVSPEEPIRWEAITATGYGTFARKMAETQQNPSWHGEGDVWSHTRMVCEQLVQLPEYHAESSRHQQLLFLAALLHDIGKIPCTVMDDGNWTSPYHAVTGARMARRYLWVDCGLCGTPEAQQLRETICWLVRYHMIPTRVLEGDDPELRLSKMASNGLFLPDFTLQRLCALAKADTLGRLADDTAQGVEKVELCALAAEELDCLRSPRPFATLHTARAYLSGRNIWPEQALFDNTWGEVILLCGLPGTGKDTWISQNCPQMPMVSLDELRHEMHISPTEPQGPVVQAGQERCREYLRAHQPFVYNATNLTFSIRAGLVKLFESYGASVRIVYLETPWQEQLRRNQSRTAVVSEAAIGRMLDKLSPPEGYEARQVEYLCV
ncbi:MAG: HD domain-containing protein [Clostridiales bacterium]|nr:HD domain-containing protein [Clostridiales bacterium]